MDLHTSEVFTFLIDLAWKSRVTLPLIVLTSMIVFNLPLQMDINIQVGHSVVDDEDLQENNSTEITSQDFNDYNTNENHSNESSEGNADNGNSEKNDDSTLRGKKPDYDADGNDQNNVEVDT